ncbi:MAG: ABC transporter permease [Planctomycetes bacterium]|nr:ABC transporter permease [Planctomycetota bacterium]
MTPRDLFRLAWGALRAHRVRTRLTYLALSIGVGSVLLLSGLGEGTRRWVENQFSSLGSNVLVALPGRTETRGGVPLLPSTTRDLTMGDLHAVERRMTGVRQVVPLVIGEATATYERRGRAVTLIGTTRAFLEIRDIQVTLGESLPAGPADLAARVCVIGKKVQRELFGGQNPLGARLKLGEYPFRVAGVIAQRGQSMMVDLDEVVLIPAANALRMLNRTGLFRMMVQLSSSSDLDRAEARLTAILRERHDDEVDFTVLTPGAVAASFGRIIRIITLALVGIAAVSLTVAGIGIMNVMIVSVTERTAEIGLMKALGASSAQVTAVFLAEAVVLSLLGGLVGIAGGVALTEAARALYPSIPFRVPAGSIALASAVAGSVGILFGLLPARRAARMEPLDALRRRL